MRCVLQVRQRHLKNTWPSFYVYSGHYINIRTLCPKTFQKGVLTLEWTYKNQPTSCRMRGVNCQGVQRLVHSSIFSWAPGLQALQAGGAVGFDMPPPTKPRYRCGLDISIILTTYSKPCIKQVEDKKPPKLVIWLSAGHVSFPCQYMFVLHFPAMPRLEGPVLLRCGFFL